MRWKMHLNVSKSKVIGLIMTTKNLLLAANYQDANKRHTFFVKNAKDIFALPQKETVLSNSIRILDVIDSRNTGFSMTQTNLLRAANYQDANKRHTFFVKNVNFIFVLLQRETVLPHFIKTLKIKLDVFFSEI